MDYSTIISEKKDKMCKITLNIPDRMNPLNLTMREELKNAFIDARNDSGIKVVYIIGAGKAFCAGGDITTMEGITTPSWRDRLKNVHQLIQLMFELEKPIIAAVNGFAAGGGLHLAIACDLIVASNMAKFQESFVNIGLIPDLGGFYFLPLRVGFSRAKELMLTGRVIDAEEAKSIGLVNRVVPHEELEEEVRGLCQSLVQGPARAYAMIKSALKLWPINLQAILELEANLQSIACSTKDFEEGRRAFLEKRKPIFTGE